MSRRGAAGILCLLLAAACGDGADTGATVTTAATDTISVASGDPENVVSLDGAVVVNVVSNGDELALAWITHDEVMVSRLDPGTGDLAEERPVNASVVPIAHPIERPALAFRDDGTLDVAFTSFAGDGASVYLSTDGGDPEPISGPARPETNLVHMTTGPDGALWMAWLESSTLSVAFEDATRVVELEDVDDRTCDCCNPVPTFLDDDLVVSYRDLDTVDGQVVRNTSVVRSIDGGETFQPVVRVADDDWFIDGCPFTGPSAVNIEGTMVLAWMDARQSSHPDQAASSIWVDRSTDRGASFGADLEVVGEGRHRWPSMAVDDAGVIHLVWETEGPDGGLSYSWSDDAGRSFASPTLLVDRELSGGNAPGSPTAVVHDGRLVVSWAAGGTGFVAIWHLGR